MKARSWRRLLSMRWVACVRGAVQRGDDRRADEPVDEGAHDPAVDAVVVVDDVELTRHRVGLEALRDLEVHAVLDLLEGGALEERRKARLGLGVAAGEQRHLVAALDEALREQATTNSMPPYRRGGSGNHGGAIIPIFMALPPGDASRTSSHECDSIPRGQAGINRAGLEGPDGRVRSVIDLHTHTRFSDGSLTPTEVVELAVREGLRRSRSPTTTASTASRRRSPPASASASRSSPASSSTSSTTRSPWTSSATSSTAVPATRCRRRSPSCARYRDERNARILERLAELGMPLDPERARRDRRRTAPPAGRTSARRCAGAATSTRSATPSSATCVAARPPGSTGGASRSRQAVRLLRDSGGLPVIAHPGIIRTDRAGLAAIVRDAARHGVVGLECHYPLHDDETVAACRAPLRALRARRHRGLRLSRRREAGRAPRPRRRRAPDRRRAARRPAPPGARPARGSGEHLTRVGEAPHLRPPCVATAARARADPATGRPTRAPLPLNPPRGYIRGVEEHIGDHGRPAASSIGCAGSRVRLAVCSA